MYYVLSIKLHIMRTINTPINPCSLQSSFPEVYSNFYRKSNVVLSSSCTLSWWPSLWYSSKIIRIKQKVPSRIYCWISANRAGRINFIDLLSFNTETDSFESVFWLWIYNNFEKVADFIKDYLDERSINIWVDINILSESFLWHWFWFYWVLSWILASVLLVYEWKLTKGDLNDYDKFIKSDLFTELFELWIKIESIFKEWKVYWSNLYTSLSNKNFPIICFYDETIQSKNFFWYDINEFFSNMSKLNDLPLDYWIINIWQKSLFDENKFIFDNYKLWFRDLKNFILSNIKLLWIEWVKNLNFAEVFNEDFFELFESASSVMVVKILHEFNELLKNPYDESTIEKFIMTIKANWKILSSLENSNKIISKILYLFKKFRKLSDEDIWIIPIVSWRIWWWFLFVQKGYKCRETLVKVIEEINKEWYENVRLEYANWRDWYSNEWLKIEQNLSEWKFSKYISENNVVVKSNNWESLIDDYSNVLKLLGSKESIIILDSINKKIYINWKKLTSKEILSQTSTIEILEKLLYNIGIDVRNNEFGYSSYSKNKNEMLWKIILPLNRLIERQYWKKLPIVCSGSMTEYYVKLEQFSRLEIVTISKLF